MTRQRLAAVPPVAWRGLWIGAVLLAGWVTWAGFSAWKAGDALRDRATAAADLLRPAADPDGEPSGDTEPVAALQRLGERRFFSPAPPQAFRSAQGVLGDRVLYPGGQSFAVGDNAMGATVKAIGIDYVELEFEGETVRVEFGSGGGGGGGHQFHGRSRGGMRGMRRRR